MPENSALPADTARQADDMLVACQYQILQTVSAWLDLRGDELLFVEGAEDFDKISDEKAQAVQIKNSPKPISLGQKEIHEVINNFWRLRERTPNRKVSLRFLTRAQATVEKTVPFGKGIRGIDLWSKSNLTEIEIRRIADFLIRQSTIVDELKQWLSSSTADAICSQLIRLIVWETSAADITFVERNIQSKLLAFAESINDVVPVSIISNVALHLQSEVWKILRQQEARYLDRLRLFEAWQSQTRVSIPQSALDVRLQQSILHSEPPIVEQLKQGAPPLPATTISRHTLVARICQTLDSKQFVNFHGSTRMGKTTLAKLVVTSTSELWSWWSAVRQSGNTTKHSLISLNRELSKDPNITNLVIDDLDLSPESVLQIEELLGDLLQMIKGRRGKIIVTSQKAIPVRIKLFFDITTDQIVRVPKLSRAEIEELASTFGCTEPLKIVGWSLLVEASTKGHPQLVAAKLLALKERSWPNISMGTFASGDEMVDSERADARQLLEMLPEEQRIMLYRLSVFPHRFRRTHAIEMGATPPALARPGALFEPLVGPWLEPLHEKYFALSPLITDCGRHALAAEDFRGLQKAAASVLFRTETPNTSDAASAFLLCWELRDGGALLELSMSMFELKENLFDYLAADLSWFAYVGLDENETLFQQDHRLSQVLRQFQFCIADSAAPEQLDSIASGWLREAEATASDDQGLGKMMFAMRILPSVRVLISAPFVIQLLKEVSEIIVANPDLPVPEYPVHLEATLGDFPKSNDLIVQLSYFNALRCKNFEFLSQFFDALEANEHAFCRRIMSGFAHGCIESRFVVDSVWLAESDLEKPDWNRCLTLFERVFELAKRWGNGYLCNSAMRGVAIVLDEYLGKPAEAHAAIDRFDASTNLEKHDVLDRHASIYFNEGKFEDAEQYWSQALTAWPPQTISHDRSAAFACRSAGISAAKQLKWENSAKWFLSIIKKLPVGEDGYFEAGAYGEAGFAWFQAGNLKQSVSTLIEAWRIADTLALGKEDLRAFKIRKTVGHIITWVHGHVVEMDTSLITEPMPGMCTSAELPPSLRELPENDSAAIWVFLARMERKLELPHMAVELGNRTMGLVTNVQVKPIVLSELMIEKVILGEVDQLPGELIAFCGALKQSANSIQLPAPVFVQSVADIDPELFQRNDALAGCAPFLAALVVTFANERSWSDVLTHWRTFTQAQNKPETWEEWFCEIETTLSRPLNETAAIVRNPNTWSQLMLCSLRIIFSDDSTPNDIFWAHSRWLREINVSPWLKESAGAFCKIMENTWKRVIQTPALFFSPKLTVPAIKSECERDNPSLEKAARILLAAAPALNVRWPKELRDYLETMASVIPSNRLPTAT